MMDKEKIKELLLEPFGTLSDEERAEIEAWAQKDEEIRRALAEARAFSGLFEKAQIARDPGAETWSGFLPGVRARIEKKTRRIPLLERRPILIPVVATVLLVLILATGKFGPNWTASYTSVEPAESIASSDTLTEAPMLTEEDYTTMNQLGVDAASVAAAIDADTVGVENDELVPESEIDAPPLMDELLALSDKDIEALLNQLAATRFM